MAKKEKKEFDWEMAEALGKIHCTEVEILAVMKTTKSKLETALKNHGFSSYTEWYAKHSSHGKMSIRRKMFEVAENGNVQMLVWLSKQYLGFREPAVELASRKIEKEEIAKLDDNTLEAVARRILQEDHKSKKGIQLVS